MTASLWKIAVFRHNKKIASHTLTADPCLIGSDPKACHIVLDDPSILPLHAEATLTDKGVQIKALFPRSAGLLLEGNAAQEVLLEKHGRCKIGKFHLLVEKDLPETDQTPATGIFTPKHSVTAKLADLPFENTIKSDDVETSLHPPISMQASISTAAAPTSATTTALSTATASRLARPLPLSAITVDEEDDEEVDPAKPLFALLSQVLSSPKTKVTGPLNAEIIVSKDNRLENYQRLSTAKRRWQLPANLRQQLPILAIELTKTALRVQLRPNTEGHVSQAEGPVNLFECAQKQKQLWQLRLAPPQFGLYVQCPPYFINIRLCNALSWQHLPPSPSLRVRGHWIAASSSALIHTALILLFGFWVISEQPSGPPLSEEVFTLVQKPPPKAPLPSPPKPPAPVKPSPARPKPHAKVHKNPQKTPHIAKHRATPKHKPAPLSPAPHPTPAPAPVPPPPGILGLLKAQNKNMQIQGNTALAAVSHITSVNNRQNQSGNYRISGLMGKLPPNQSLSTGAGNSEIVTKGYLAMQRGSGALRGSHGQKVEAMVENLPKLMSLAGSGFLDKKAIDLVVSQHAAEISRCYEQSLLRYPGLQGKLSLEWIIGLRGQVVSVRQESSTLQSPLVARCIMKLVQTWHFKAPSGGEVVVNYPFLFKSTEF